VEINKIVYVSDCVFEENGVKVCDPFYEILKTLDAEVTFRHDPPEDFNQIDLLILHPFEMNAQIFETIDHGKHQKRVIKTIVISNAHESDLFLQAINVGVDKYLLKPIDPEAVKKVAVRLIQHVMEAKQAEKAYKQINLMVRAISQTSLLVRMNRDGIIIEVNDLLSHLLGISSDRIIGSHWKPFVEHRFWLYLQLLIREHLREGETHRRIIELVGSAGEILIVDATIYAIRDELGAVEEIVFIGQDVSEVNRAILASMEQLIDYDTSLTVLFDHRYEAILVNRKYLELNGYHQSEDFLNSCDVWTWMIEDTNGASIILSDGHGRKESLESIFIGVRNHDIQDKVIVVDSYNNKRYYTVHISSMANPIIRSEQYHILYFVDVTHLERLKEEKLSDAKLMIVGRLAAAITHEINTPITYIKGNLELLKWECEGKITQLESYFKPINEGVERIESIVASMYEFASTGKEEMKPCSLDKTLVNALRFIMNRAKHITPILFNGVMFSNSTKYDEKECITMGILTRLEQVWIIIINNALDEFEKGGLRYEDRQLSLYLHCNAHYAIVRISDNAGGISASMLDGIFDFAVGGDKKKSMGIGLNVAKAIIDKHGGTIRVSNENNGATFEIVLKIYKEKE